tara:strand:+ start:316 stop:1059 length:744 start_codon:yes stop_codon:yes gene_type:complete
MKFDKLEYLSPTTINLFVRDKAKFILKLAQLDDFNGNPATLRGQAVEKAILGSVFYKQKSIEELIEEARGYFSSELLGLSQKQDDKKIQSERNSLAEYISVGIPPYRRIEDEPIDTQGKIKVELEGVKLPIYGYYDIQFENHIRDLKTTRTIPFGIPYATQRQLALYAYATKKEVWVDYVSRKKYSSKKITDIPKIIAEVTHICQGIEKFMAITDDIHELASMHHPNLDSWEWGEDDINNWKKLGVS